MADAMAEEVSRKNRCKDRNKEWLAADALKSIDGLPDFGFRLRFDHIFTEQCKPFTMPHIHQIPRFLGFSFRYARTWFQHYWKGQRMFIDNFNLIPWRPIYGVPLGGIGCGTIGRGYRGEFCRYQLIPGIYKYNVVHANQFIVCIRRNGETVYQQVLSPHGPPAKCLTSWKWGFPSEDAVYHALYPRSWTVYWIPEWNVRLVCRQISPVFPNDYQDTSLPCGVFVWSIENHSAEPLDISITFTYQNGQGDSSGDDVAGGVWNKAFVNTGEDCSVPCNSSHQVSGVSIHQMFGDMKCVCAVAARHSPGVDVSHLVAFDPRGCGKEVWNDLKTHGKLVSSVVESDLTTVGEQVACAVCAQSTLLPLQSSQAEFSLTWDMPVINFGAKENIYRRRYTRYFGSDGLAAPKLSFYALNFFNEWEEKIERWQGPILQSGGLPAWYKSALFNELYYVSDGGTVWIDVSDDQWASPLVQEFGRFAYLEGHEYRMFNTYDVHHYASFALLMLWPKLQLGLQYDIAMIIPREQAHQVAFCMSGETGVSKQKDCVPHDVGDPSDEPWVRSNAYLIHPTHEWKDLNIKFVTQVYRDYVHTGDLQFLEAMYPMVSMLMKKSLQWDVDGDGIIDNSGFADQTFDAWTITGTSAYCGGMWLAAVKVFCEMAKVCNHNEDLMIFTTLLEKAKASYERKLWNGKYYNFDSSDSGHHDSIMSAQIVGHWFLKASKVADDTVFPRDHVLSSLKMIFEHNVMPFDGGRMGAINGMRPDGKKDLSSPQSDEFWTGVTYAVAADMMQEGMIEEAWQTAYGAYHTCYERYGLAFQTPEAYFDDQRYRSLGYMRPLCVWAIQYAIETFQKSLLQKDSKQHKISGS